MLKKKRALLLFILFVPFALPREGDPSAQVDTQAKGINYSYLPQLEFDTADLDARDAQNRPIKSAAAQGELASLFVQNLFNLVVYADPHNIDQARSGLELFSALFHKLIFTSIPAVAAWLQEALLPSKQRFVHNVGNLWAIISVGLLLINSWVAAFFHSRTPLRLNLRC